LSTNQLRDDTGSDDTDETDANGVDDDAADDGIAAADTADAEPVGDADESPTATDATETESTDDAPVEGDDSTLETDETGGGFESDDGLESAPDDVEQATATDDDTVAGGSFGADADVEAEFEPTAAFSDDLEEATDDSDPDDDGMRERSTTMCSMTPRPSRMIPTRTMTSKASLGTICPTTSTTRRSPELTSSTSAGRLGLARRVWGERRLERSVGGVIRRRCGRFGRRHGR